jgi:hypothetical protein
MKRLGIISLLGVMAFASLAQRNSGTLVASIAGADRLSLVKNSISIPAWHEKTFWPMYEDYLKNIGGVSSSAYRYLDEFAKTEQYNDDKEAFEMASKMIGSRYDLLALRERYYSQMGSAFNGVIALQFLQTEALLDMMESSRIYESTHWKNYRFHPTALNAAQLKTSKHNTINTALSLPENKLQAFWEIYNRYEEECNALLADDYSMVSLYAGDPADYTPALAKLLGTEFLHVLQREVKLKEKYFNEMNRMMGGSVAARFLAWEDYYSLISKMHAWAGN